MIYTISMGDYFQRFHTPFELFDNKKINSFEFFKIFCSISSDIFGKFNEDFYVYDYDTVLILLSELYSKENITSFARGKDLYIFRKIMGVYDNGIPPLINDVEKEYCKLYNKKMYSEDFANLIDEICNRIYDIAFIATKEKIIDLDERVYKGYIEDSMEQVILDDEAFIDRKTFTRFLKYMLKKHNLTPLDVFRPVFSSELQNILVQSEIEDFSDITRMSKYIDLSLPDASEKASKELVDFVHSTGSKFIDETDEELSEEMLNNITLYNWKHPAKPSIVGLYDTVYELPLKDETINVLLSHGIKYFKDILNMSSKDINKLSSNIEEVKDVKKLVLRCNAYDYVQNSSNVHFPPKR